MTPEADTTDPTPVLTIDQATPVDGATVRPATRDAIATAIRDDVLDGRLSPGDRLPEPQPLEAELTGRGARYLGGASTSPSYRLYALDTAPPKPGLVHTHTGGAEIAGGVWRVPAAGLASFVRALPSPMTLGQVELSDGGSMTGFGCATSALDSAVDITEYGGWLRYLGREVSPGTSSVKPGGLAVEITG
ncbi:hypothetical protein [Gordonia sp. JH63]|uniref:allophanate hydrolase-related protein n=1 Tax=Gordonia sp. JH63 TaxID=2698900 RepID=UPI001EEF9C6B|nr:hypothetical protein [Gordonia sp. JH63]